MSQHTQQMFIQAFQERDKIDIGIIPLEEVQRLLEKITPEISKDILNLVAGSGACFVRYASFMEWMFKATSQGKSILEQSYTVKDIRNENENNFSAILNPELAEDSKPVYDELKDAKAEIAMLKKKVLELEALCKDTDNLDQKRKEVHQPDTNIIVDRRTVKEKYLDALNNVGGDAAIKACRLQSMYIAGLIRESLREDEKPWEQDMVYRGLDPNVLLEDAGTMDVRFNQVCKELAHYLCEKSLQADVMMAPRKGITRSMTKVNVKYGGDIIQLTDALRGTLKIKEAGTGTLERTYAALLDIVRSPPKGVRFLHFDDRYRNPMHGGYRDFLFLVNIGGMVCELQINFESMLLVKEGDGHYEYEITRLNNDLMLVASQKNDSSAVKEHLNKGANPNYTTAMGFTPLTYAALHNNSEMASSLLDTRADPFQADLTGLLPLNRALDLQKYGVAKVILENMAHLCADRNQALTYSPSANTGVIRAWAAFFHCFQSHTQAQKYSKSRRGCARFDSNLDVDEVLFQVQDLFHNVFERVSGGLDSALCDAAQAGLADVCGTIIEMQASPNVRVAGSGHGPERPLDMAIVSGSVGTVMVLLDHAATAEYFEDVMKRDLFVQNAIEEDLVHQLEALAEASNGQDWIDMRQLLLMAADNGSMLTARFALRRGADAHDLECAMTKRLLLKAVRSDDSEIVALLHDKSADLGKCSDAVRDAARLGRLGMIQLLAEAKCPLEERASSPVAASEIARIDRKWPEGEARKQLGDSIFLGVAPIHLAAKAGHTDVVRALHSWKCSVVMPSFCGNAPIHYAVEAGHTQTILALYELGGVEALSLRNGFGQVAMHRASRQVESVLVLLRLRCDVNDMDWLGHTPLRLAAKGAAVDAMKTLVAAQADVNVQDYEGNTAAHLAASRDDDRILKELVCLRADLNLQNAAGQTPKNSMLRTNYRLSMR
eukprot:gnl/MRDRNA2_/MRDRNA2_197314_c0_seq1.p1 gnl/MRDRNA2_/MRDRNA2_197314_c0~~gnl/MRDRNA2_/MRDRNA2_197314_c0_seq1.p1  ORF type:complete len:946 (-),score=195.64 gnl/MRDRNA2_/MRDRNA2_197314_c0_seq1:264-3101(-)